MVNMIRKKTRIIPARKQSRPVNRSYKPYNGEKHKLNRENIVSCQRYKKHNINQMQLTSPIRFSRHNTTELLVAAEQTASLMPYTILSKTPHFF
jgi:hypothetical protein